MRRLGLVSVVRCCLSGFLLWFEKQQQVSPSTVYSQKARPITTTTAQDKTIHRAAHAPAVGAQLRVAGVLLEQRDARLERPRRLERCEQALEAADLVLQRDLGGGGEVRRRVGVERRERRRRGRRLLRLRLLRLRSRLLRRRGRRGRNCDRRSSGGGCRGSGGGGGGATAAAGVIDVIDAGAAAAAAARPRRCHWPHDAPPPAAEGGDAMRRALRDVRRCDGATPRVRGARARHGAPLAELHAGTVCCLFK